MTSANYKFRVLLSLLVCAGMPEARYGAKVTG